jgi:hypothetical protein
MQVSLAQSGSEICPAGKDLRSQDEVGKLLHPLLFLEIYRSR